jgi:hypothetical protein
MRASKTAIREMPISQRTPPQTGPVTGRAVAKDDAHIAVATAANSFFVVPSTSLGRVVEVGERLSLRFQRGLPSLENDRTRARRNVARRSDSDSVQSGGHPPGARNRGHHGGRIAPSLMHDPEFSNQPTVLAEDGCH